MNDEFCLISPRHILHIGQMVLTRIPSICSEYKFDITLPIPCFPHYRMNMSTSNVFGMKSYIQVNYGLNQEEMTVAAAKSNKK